MTGYIYAYRNLEEMVKRYTTGIFGGNSRRRADGRLPTPLFTLFMNLPQKHCFARSGFTCNKERLPLVYNFNCLSRILVMNEYSHVGLDIRARDDI